MYKIVLGMSYYINSGGLGALVDGLRLEGDMALYFLRASQLPSFHACCSRFRPEAPLGQGNAVNPALGARRAGVGNLIRRH